MSTVTDIFNPGGIASPESKTSDLYNPNHKQGKGGIYKSVIRFLPWHADPNNSIVSKYVAYLVNPANPSEARYVDNPFDNSPITNAYWRLVNTKNVKFEEFAKKHLSSKKYYYALVQIMADEQKPELVGQIKVYRFAKKIYEKINAELNPPQGEGINPLHPIYGRKFSLVITEQSGFPNYDQSSFFDERSGSTLAPSGMWYRNPQTGHMEIATEQTDPNLIFDYLRQYSPDLSKYNFQEWSEADKTFVNNVLTVTDNYMKTGTVATAQQSVTQQSFGVINNTPTLNPVFPGANVPTQSVPVSTVPVSTVPVSTPMVQQFESGAPTAPVAAPFSAPQQMPVGVPSVAPQPMVVGVDIPVVTPSGGANMGAPTPNRGMNVDDILKDL